MRPDLAYDHGHAREAAQGLAGGGPLTGLGAGSTNQLEGQHRKQR
jgi:hypothetical protein